jgi:6-phosphogluconolactonase (cycloisomerase 2 family)
MVLMDNDTVQLLVGTYPADGAEPGSGEGIWRVTLDRRSGALGAGQLAITTTAPSFLALHPSGRVLYAVGETEQGEVSAFSLYGDQLRHLRTVPTGGSFPCHLLASGEALWAANYGDGVVTRLDLNDDGEPLEAPAVYRNAGSGPNQERQEGPHAHYVHDAGNGSVWVTDLGTDEVRRFTRSGPDGLAAVLPPGTGPRHLAALAGGAVVVVGELDSRLHVLSVGNGSVLSSVPALATSVPDGQPSQPSHIDVGVSTATRNLLYAATRGPDVLAVFAVTDGSVLTHLSDTPVGGVWPRHFAVVSAHDASADFVVVANQYSSSLDVLRVDGAGHAEQVHSLALPVPACVVLER